MYVGWMDGWMGGVDTHEYMYFWKIRNIVQCVCRFKVFTPNKAHVFVSTQLYRHTDIIPRKFRTLIYPYYQWQSKREWL